MAATIKSAKKAKNSRFSRKLNGIPGEIGAAPRLVNDRSLFARRSSVLAFRAVEGGAPGLGDPGDGPTAICPHTSQAFAIVDFEDVLEIAQFAVGLPMV